MWPFNRRKKTDEANVPDEVREYYQSEHRERIGLAWLVAFLTLIFTIAIVVGVFFGGRWMYGKVTNKSSTDTAQKSGQSNQPTPSPTNQSVQNNPDSSPKKNQPPTPTPSQPTPNPSQSTPTTNQPSGQRLTNTGPGDTLAIFVLVTALGTLAHAGYRRGQIRISR